MERLQTSASIMILIQQVGKMNLVDYIVLVAGIALGLVIVNLVHHQQQTVSTVLMLYVM